MPVALSLQKIPGNESRVQVIVEGGADEPLAGTYIFNLALLLQHGLGSAKADIEVLPFLGPGQPIHTTVGRDEFNVALAEPGLVEVRPDPPVAAAAAAAAAVVRAPVAAPAGVKIRYADRSSLRAMISAAGLPIEMLARWGLGHPGNIATSLDVVPAGRALPERTGSEWIERMRVSESGGFSCGSTSTRIMRLLGVGMARADRISGLVGVSPEQNRACSAAGVLMVDALMADLAHNKLARITLGPHSFIVENIGRGELLIHQSYDGQGGAHGFDLSKSVMDAEPMHSVDLENFLKLSIRFRELASGSADMATIRAFRVKHFFDHPVDAYPMSAHGALSFATCTRSKIRIDEAVELGKLLRLRVETLQSNVRQGLFGEDSTFQADALYAIAEGEFSGNKPPEVYGSEYRQVAGFPGPFIGRIENNGRVTIAPYADNILQEPEDDDFEEVMNYFLDKYRACDKAGLTDTEMDLIRLEIEHCLEHRLKGMEVSAEDAAKVILQAILDEMDEIATRTGNFVLHGLFDHIRYPALAKLPPKPQAVVNEALAAAPVPASEAAAMLDALDDVEAGRDAVPAPASAAGVDELSGPGASSNSALQEDERARQSTQVGGPARRGPGGRS